MDNPEKLVTQGKQEKDKQNNGQSSVTGNIGYRRRRQEKQKQSRETGNIGSTTQ